MFKERTFRYQYNVDPLKDISITIKRLDGNTFKSIAMEYKVSYSVARSRYEKTIRRLNYLAKKYDQFIYEKLYSSNKEEVCAEYKKLAIEYNQYVKKHLETGDFYKPFKKDITKILKDKKMKKCNECGRYYKDNI